MKTIILILAASAGYIAARLDAGHYGMGFLDFIPGFLMLAAIYLLYQISSKN